MAHPLPVLAPDRSASKRIDGALAPMPNSPAIEAKSAISAAPPARAWHFLCHAEIMNFATLRRHLGRVRADRLALDAGAHMADRVAASRMTPIGRALIELAFEGDVFEDAATMLEAIRVAFAEGVELDGTRHQLDILVGIAAAPRDNADDIRMAEEAEGALDQARTERRSIIRDVSSGTPTFDRLSLAREIAQGIENQEMFLQYQPKVHVRRQEISSCEALVRWQHPIRGLIMPGDFIPMAEEMSLISGLTLWTLDRVIADQRILAADGHDLTIFINISGQLLADDKFVARACQVMRESEAKIGFEITETSVIRDPQSAIANLQTFADVGITISIDDYGAGLSSLAYLKQLPARELKIDKMFVLQLTSSNRDPLIVRSTIDLAHALEMEVTAEGVETQAALALLTVMGCDMVQGYLISRPISIDAFRAFMDEDRARGLAEVAHPMFHRPPSFWKTG